MSTTNSVEILDSEWLKSYHSLETLYLHSNGISKDEWQTNSWETLTETGHTPLTPRRHITQRQILDAAETRGQGSLEGCHGNTTMGHSKQKIIKLGPQHYPIHQWQFAGKEKGGEKERYIRKRKYKCNLTAGCFTFKYCQAVTILSGSGLVGTATDHSNICSGTNGQDTATLSSHARHQTSEPLSQVCGEPHTCVQHENLNRVGARANSPSNFSFSTRG